jgi:hypothetical protein
MSGDLATRATILPMSQEAIEDVRRFESRLAKLPQIPLDTQHVIHAGMYARTITIPAGVAITGALIKRATLLIVSGHAIMTLCDGAVTIEGYQVIPASAGRKQAFFAYEDTTLTMIFPTRATSVDEAEREFTDEHERLISRHTENEVIITGE